MLVSNQQNTQNEQISPLIRGLKSKFQIWVRRHLIAEDPYDQEAWDAALLLTQRALDIEPFPKELR